MKSLRAIFFDVGNTLMTFDYSAVAKVLQNIDSSALEKVSPSAWKALNREFEISRIQERYEVDTLRYLLRHMLTHARVPVVDTAIEAVLRENDTLSLWRCVNPDATRLVRAIRRRGVRTGVISNADGKVEQLLGINGWSGLFEFIIDSAIVGVSKPDKEIFQIAIDRMGLRADETAYVGDLPAIDIRGAVCAGMFPILYDPHNLYEEECTELERELKIRIDRVMKMEQIVDFVIGRNI